MSEPKPIETAPKDGKIIIGLRVEHYGYGGEAYWEGSTMMWEGGPIMKGAWAYTGIMVSLVEKEHLPTHWMPLSEPPE